MMALFVHEFLDSGEKNLFCVSVELVQIQTRHLVKNLCRPNMKTAEAFAPAACSFHRKWDCRDSILGFKLRRSLETLTGHINPQLLLVGSA